MSVYVLSSAIFCRSRVGSSSHKRSSAIILYCNNDFYVEYFYVPDLFVKRRKLKGVKSLLNPGWSDSGVHVILPFN